MVAAPLREERGVGQGELTSPGWTTRVARRDRRAGRLREREVDLLGADAGADRAAELSVEHDPVDHGDAR